MGEPMSDGELTAQTRSRAFEPPARGDVRSVALTGLFVLAFFYTIYFTRSILLPLILAVILSYLVRPVVRGLGRLRIPAGVAAALILLVVVGGTAFGISFLAAPANGWLQKAPESLQQLQRKLLPLRQRIEHAAQANVAIEKMASAPNAQTKTVELKQHPVTDLLYFRTPQVLMSAVLLLILLYFLLAYEGQFLPKVINLMPQLADKKRAVSIAHEIEAHLSRYLVTVAIINACLGLAVGTSVGLLGLPNAPLWGVLVAVLNFVPYLGAFTGIICMTLGSVLSYDNLGYALIFPGIYLAFVTVEGNFITPLVMGKTLTLNPLMIVLALAFWGWMWGVVGVILAVPILAAFKIFCAHIESLEPIAEFLS